MFKLSLERTRFRRRLFAGAAVISLLSATNAWAEGEATASDKATAQTESGQQGDIVVTARFKQERLQDVPVSVTAVTATRLKQAGITELAQLQFEAPSLNISISNPRMTNIGIRGLGNNPAADGLSASVGIYLDGVYLDRPGMGTFDLVDIQRIEVLRGPQGTVFGKNTTAGAFSITTQEPSFKPDVVANASVGSLNLRQVQASVTGPISDTLAFRVSGYLTRRDGYLKNILLGGAELSREREGVRAQLLYKPNDDISWRLIGEYGREDGSASSFVFYNAGPSASASSSFVPYNVWAARVGATTITNPSSLTTDQNEHQHQVQTQYAVTSNFNAKLGELTLTSITGYRDWNFVPFNDLDWTNVDVIRNSGTLNHERQVSQELRLATSPDKPLELVGGAYYFHRYMNADAVRTYGSLYSVGLGSGAALNNATTHTYANPEVDSYALFAQATWHVVPKLDLTAGFRESYETATETVTRTPLTGGTGTPPASVAPFSGSLRVASWSPSLMTTLSYKADRDVLLFATYSYGGKAGGFNTTVPTTGNMQTLAVQPEKASNYEVGVKSTLFDRHVTLNVSAYLTNVSGYQANAIYPDATGVLVSQITNAGKVQAKGVELETTIRATPSLTLGGSLSYNDAVYKSFINAPAVQGSVATTQDLSGRPVNNDPKWSINFNSQYRHAITPDIDGYIGADVSHKTGYFGNIDDSAYSWVKPYTIANFRIGAAFKKDRYDLSAWVRNAFNNIYFYSVISTSTGSGGYFAAPSEPRTYGVTFAVHL